MNFSGVFKKIERENVEGYTNKRTECLRTMKGRIKGKNK
jgi:hypothetical protein